LAVAAWTVAIAVETVTFVGIFPLETTYAPCLLEKKTLRLKQKNLDIDYRTNFIKLNMNADQILTHSLGRPVRTLFTSPILAFMTIYLSL
jgi:hypothetical protein